MNVKLRQRGAPEGIVQGAQTVGLAHSVPPDPSYLFSISLVSHIPSVTKLSEPTATGYSVLLAPNACPF